MNSPQEKTFIVSLKGLAPWISSVKYEKGGEDLKLYFTLHKEGLSAEHLSLQEEGQDTLIVGNNRNLFQLLATQESPTPRLLGKLLSTIEYIPSNTAYLTSPQQLTQKEARLLPQLFPMLKKFFGNHCSYLVFFETNQQLQGLGWTSNPVFREKVLRTFHAQQKGNWLLFTTNQQTLKQASYAFSSSF